MKKIIIVIIILNAIFFNKIVIANEKDCLNIELIIFDNEINVEYTRRLKNCSIPKKIDVNNLSYILYDVNNNILDKGILYTTDEELLKSGIYRFNIPHFSKINNIKIFDNNIEKKNIDLSKYDNCGNGTCDQWENSKNCAIDCQTGLSDGVCDGFIDKRCDLDCFIEKKDNDTDCQDINLVENKDEINNYLASMERKEDAKTKESPQPDKKNIAKYGGLVGYSLLAIVFFIFVVFLKKKFEKKI